MLSLKKRRHECRMRWHRLQGRATIAAPVSLLSQVSRPATTTPWLVDQVPVTRNYVLDKSVSLQPLTDIVSITDVQSRLGSKIRV